ncbi:MAG: hypothetical protein ACFCVE_08710 [Phycisphaerae bacterium]
MALESAFATPLPAMVLSEFRRTSGDQRIDNSQFIEVVLQRDVSAAELATLRVGDSITTLTEASGNYGLVNPAQYLPPLPDGSEGVFRAGTIITLGAPGVVTEDHTYNPAAGDFTLAFHATPGNPRLTTSNGLASMGRRDVVWVGTAGADHVDQAIIWNDRSDFAGNLMARKATNRVPVPSSSVYDEIIYANAGYTGIGTDASFSIAQASAGTPGGPNNAAQAAYLAALRSTIGRDRLIWDSVGNGLVAKDGPGTWAAFSSVWTVENTGLRATWNNIDRDDAIFGAAEPSPDGLVRTSSGTPHRVEVVGLQLANSLTFRPNDVGYWLTGGQVWFRADGEPLVTTAGGTTPLQVTMDVQRDTLIETWVIAGFDQSWHVDPSAELRFSGFLEGEGRVDVAGGGEISLGGTPDTPQKINSTLRIMDATAAVVGSMDETSSGTLVLAGGLLDVVESIDLGPVSLAVEGGRIRLAAGAEIVTDGGVDVLGPFVIEVLGDVPSINLGAFNLADVGLLQIEAPGLPDGTGYLPSLVDGQLVLTQGVVPEPTLLAPLAVLGSLVRRRR